MFEIWKLKYMNTCNKILSTLFILMILAVQSVLIELKFLSISCLRGESTEGKQKYVVIKECKTIWEKYCKDLKGMWAVTSCLTNEKHQD